MQSLRAVLVLPMHELVRPDFHSKPSLSPRLPSFAGRGLPERMRTTVFAFLGLTAAAGLALVALFAQLGFPLLSPTPLPSGPEERNAVAEAVSLDRGAGAIGVAPARGAVAAPRASRGGGLSGSDRRGDDKAAVDSSPAPVSAAEPGTGPGGAEPAETPSPTATPAPSPTSSEAPASTVEPAPAPAAPASPVRPEAKPANSKPPKAEAKPAKSKPVKPEPKPSKPGKSEAKPAKPEAKPPKPAPEASAAPPAPAPAPAPVETGGGNGKGKASGHNR